MCINHHAGQTTQKEKGQFDQDSQHHRGPVVSEGSKAPRRSNAPNDRSIHRASGGLGLVEHNSNSPD